MLNFRGYLSCDTPDFRGIPMILGEAPTQCSDNQLCSHDQNSAQWAKIVESGFTKIFDKYQIFDKQ